MHEALVCFSQSGTLWTAGSDSPMSVVERIEYHDVEGLRVGRFTGQLNTTCILYRLGGTVIDTGPPNQWRFVRRFLGERRVGKVLVTHHHEDHSGNLAAVQRRFADTAYAPEAGIEPLSAGFPVQLYRRIVWGRPDRVRPAVVPARLEVAGGLSLVAVPTPGHSSDSTCFLLPERGWLFSGDLYIAARTRYLRRDESVDLQIASLRRVLKLDFETLLCSHRGVLEEGRQLLERKLDYLAALRDKARELRARGLEVYEISRLLLGREGWMRRFTRAHFSKENLIESCLEGAGTS